MSAIEIRPCRPEDIPVLETHMGSPGRTGFHERRLARQEAGEATYLIAWIADVPVGHVLMRWKHDREGSETEPELNALHVTSALRSRGIGRALIAAGEALARERGYDRVGLGVGLTNDDAKRLYERLGYRDAPGASYVDRWTWIDDDGIEHEDREVCSWMVKPLARGEG